MKSELLAYAAYTCDGTHAEYELLAYEAYTFRDVDLAQNNCLDCLSQHLKKTRRKTVATQQK